MTQRKPTPFTGGRMSHSLEKKGYLKSRVVKGFSRAQKLYSITPGGRRVAETAKKLLIRHIGATKKLIEEEFE